MNCSRSEQVFGWPVSDAVAEILERVKLAEGICAKHEDSFDRNMESEVVPPSQNRGRDQLDGADVQKISDISKHSP